jgi:hypothetical protein
MGKGCPAPPQLPRDGQRSAGGDALPLGVAPVVLQLRARNQSSSCQKGGTDGSHCSRLIAQRARHACPAEIGGDRFR